MSTANKLTYLNGTKQAIKQAINEDFEVVYNNTTFREYADEISSNNAKYKDLIPKETINATNTLDISNSSGLDKTLVTQYGNTYQETTTGKNLFKASSSNYPQGLNITYDSDKGTITFSGTTTGTYPTLSNFTEANIPAGTYTFSIDKALPYNLGCRFRNSSGQYPSTVILSAGELSKSIALSYDAVRIELVYSVTEIGVTIPTTTIKPMVEPGSTATDWEKYTGNIPAPNLDYPQEIVNISGNTVINVTDNNNHSKNYNIDLPVLCKTGDYKDRIYSLNGKWYLENFSKKVTIDGTNIAVTNRRETNTSGNYTFIFLFPKKAKRVDGNITQVGYCDKLVSKPRNNIYGRTQGFGYGATNNDYWGDIVIFRTDWATKTVEDVNTDLKSNPIELEYLLDSPEITEITESNYPTLYNQLNNIKLFEGVNHITMTNESGLDVEFDIEYYKDWKLD